jgi:hypothetical protein
MNKLNPSSDTLHPPPLLPPPLLLHPHGAPPRSTKTTQKRTIHAGSDSTQPATASCYSGIKVRAVAMSRLRRDWSRWTWKGLKQRLRPDPLEPTAFTEDAAEIATPGAYIVPGYSNIMPTTFATSLTPTQISELVSFIAAGQAGK